MLAVLFVATSLALSATAVVTPLEPAPGLNFIPGTDCSIVWDADTSGTWTQTYVQLMTGSNADMRHLTTVLGPFDGTNAAVTTYTYPCPNVTIHAPVLFYQFTSPATLSGADDVQWTGRFSISPPAELVAPPLTDAAGIGYGNAELVVPSAAVPPPPTAPGGNGDVPAPSSSTQPSTTTTGNGVSQSSSSSNSGRGTSTTGSGRGSTTSASQATNTNITDPDAALSLRGSAAAILAAASAVFALL